jgi:hypothetical protein
VRRHLYLLAYMAGIVVPTIFLLVVLTVFTIARYGYGVSLPIERVIVFPMAVVPNVWGLWNMLYQALRGILPLPLGVHGALLPFLLIPLGYLLKNALGVDLPGAVTSIFPVAVLVILAVYYLAWKYLVGYLNDVVGIG